MHAYAHTCMHTRIHSCLHACTHAPARMCSYLRYNPTGLQDCTKARSPATMRRMRSAAAASAGGNPPPGAATDGRTPAASTPPKVASPNPGRMRAHAPCHLHRAQTRTNQPRVHLGLLAGTGNCWLVADSVGC